MIKQLTLAWVERAINRLLAHDPLICCQMAPLEGKVVALALSDLQQRCYITFGESQLGLQTDLIGDADLTIEGELADFVKMGLQRDRDVLPQGLKIGGDAHLAQQLQRFMAAAKVDWEGILAPLTGDFIATRFSKMVRYGKQQMARNREQLKQNTQAFLQHECPLLPAKEEVDQFCQQVDQLRHDVARLEAKWQRLLFKRAGRR